MNIMPSASSIKKTPSHNKRNVIIAVVVVIVILALGVGTYFMFLSPQAKTTALNNKMEDIAAQLASIPNLDTKENLDKYNRLVDEFEAARKQQESLLRAQIANLK